MRVATVTTFFPNAANRHRAVFVENLVRAMSSRCTVEVIAPVPFAPPLKVFPEWYRQSQIPRHEAIDGIDVEHPRFIVMPKLDVASGLTYAAGVLPALRRFTGARDVVLHAHCAYPDGVGVGLAARVLGLPYVITAHGSDINVYAQYSRLAWQIRWALGGAAAVIAVSRSLHAKITRLLGAAADRTPLHQIACAGFNPAVFFPGDRAEARRELGVLPQGRVVIFVGQLVTIKAVDRLVEAWRLLAADGRARPEDRLILVGEGPTRDALERQVADASLADRVTFAGAYPQATVARWLRGADVLCLPSHNEGTPNVIVEALASGVPVVASDVGGIPDMIEPDVSGLLVPPGDAPALAGALAAALARPWDRDRVRQTVASRTWDAIGAATVDVLAEVVNNTAGDRRAAVA